MPPIHSFYGANMKMKHYANEQFPHLIHGGDYNPEQWIDTPSVWDEDMRLMKLANCNEMTVGIFAWSALEPQEGKYDFSFLDETIDRVFQNGGRIMLATPSGARPHWMADKYPEVLRVDGKGQRLHFSARHNHCFTSPVYREKVREINTLLAKRYGNHPAVIAWHISNEYGGECYCPLCQNAFRDFLRRKYEGDIGKLNRAYWTSFWSHTYDSFDQIEAPSELGERSIHGLNLDWKRFVTAQTVDFIKNEIAPIKEICPSVPVTTNMMYAFDGLDYNKLGEVLDIASWDSYPEWHSGDQEKTAQNNAFWHDFFRTLKGRPFLMMESTPSLVNWKEINKLKRPGMDLLASVQAIAHGSDSVQYFQWRKSRGSVEKFHGAVVDHVGTEHTRVFQAVKRTGEILGQIDEIAGCDVSAEVAILYDWENMWALDDSQAFAKNKKYTETCYGYHKALWKRGINCDIIGTDADLSKYKLVIAPMLYLTSEATIDKLNAYVAAGGTLYATYMLGMVDENDLCYLGGFPAGNLREVFGIWNEEIDTLFPEETGEVVMGGKTYPTVDYSEIIHAEGATVLATYGKEFYAGMPAFTSHVYGKGKAYYQAFRDTGLFQDEVLETLSNQLGLQRSIPSPAGGLPYGVTAHTRTDGQTVYLFVENYSDDPVEHLELGAEMTDMLTGERRTACSLPPYGFAIFKSQDKA